MFPETAGADTGAGVGAVAGAGAGAAGAVAGAEVKLGAGAAAVLTLVSCFNVEAAGAGAGACVDTGDGAGEEEAVVLNAASVCVFNVSALASSPTIVSSSVEETLPPIAYFFLIAIPPLFIFSANLEDTAA